MLACNSFGLLRPFWSTAHSLVDVERITVNCQFISHQAIMRWVEYCRLCDEEARFCGLLVCFAAYLELGLATGGCAVDTRTVCLAEDQCWVRIEVGKARVF